MKSLKLKTYRIGINIIVAWGSLFSLYDNKKGRFLVELGNLEKEMYHYKEFQLAGRENQSFLYKKLNQSNNEELKKLDTNGRPNVLERNENDDEGNKDINLYPIELLTFNITELPTKTEMLEKIKILEKNFEDYMDGIGYSSSRFCDSSTADIWIKVYLNAIIDLNKNYVANSSYLIDNIQEIFPNDKIQRAFIWVIYEKVISYYTEEKEEDYIEIFKKFLMLGQNEEKIFEIFLKKSHQSKLIQLYSNKFPRTSFLGELMNSVSLNDYQEFYIDFFTKNPGAFEDLNWVRRKSTGTIYQKFFSFTKNELQNIVSKVFAKNPNSFKNFIKSFTHIWYYKEEIIQYETFAVQEAMKNKDLALILLNAQFYQSLDLKMTFYHNDHELMKNHEIILNGICDQTPETLENYLKEKKNSDWFKDRLNMLKALLDRKEQFKKYLFLTLTFKELQTYFSSSDDMTNDSTKMVLLCRNGLKTKKIIIPKPIIFNILKLTLINQCFWKKR